MKHGLLLSAALWSIAALAGCVSPPRLAPRLASQPTPASTAAAAPFNIAALGAIGDGKEPATAVLQKALDRCAAQGGGEVVVPAGDYLIGSVRIGSNTTLRLSGGATLIGSPDPNDYPLIPVRFEGEAVEGHRALLYADHASHIAIVGPGTIQGDPIIGSLRHPRAPTMLELVNCDHVCLEGFKDRYRKMWSIHLLLCHDVLARDLNIRTTRANGDGIDVDSTTDAKIEHCDIDTGDDCISLKSGRGMEAAQLQQSTADILISDCTLGSDFAGIGIGTEMSGGVRDVRIQRCKFTRGTNAIFFKSRTGRGGFIQNIAATDLQTSGKTCIGINLLSKGIVGTSPLPGKSGVPLMKNISFNNINIRAGTLVDGSNVSPEKRIENFSLTNVTGTCSRGISLANATGTCLADIHVTGYGGPFLQTENVSGTGLESAVPLSVGTIDDLKDAFFHPPDNARPMVRWWWFGPAVTKAELAREIDTMKAGGFGGFEVQPTYPLAVDGQPRGLVNLKFLSPEFLDDLNFVAAKAKDVGLRMDLTLGSGWPYGGSIFPITEGAGRLHVEQVKVAPGQPQIQCPALHPGETLIAAFAGAVELKIDHQSVEIPSPMAATGVTVQFFIGGRTGMKVKRPAYGAEGYVLDHDSPAVVSKFIDQIATKEVNACGDNPPYSLFCDSLEVGGEDWTDDFLTEFQKRRGYDLRPLLPALISDIGPRTLAIRHDWGQTLTELFNDSFVKPLKNLAEDHQSRFRIQAYGLPSAGLFSYADANLPEGEGWQWHEYRASRYASSACHLMGIPVSSSEAFTWIHNLVFRATPLDIKAEADLHFLQGINQLICHGWPYTAAGVPDPGWSFYAAGVFDEKNPWWIVMPDLNRYIQRVSSMMRQGKPANDVLLYLANDDAWSQFTPGIGREPTRISLSDGVGQCLGNEIIGRILDAGYNLDFFDDQMLDRLGRIDHGSIAFGDLRYKVVVLAGVQRMPISTLRKLDAFARDGGIVIATRQKPAIVPGMNATAADQQEARAICQRLFDDKEAPGIFVSDESRFGDALGSRLAPDVAFSPGIPQIGVVHRHVRSADIYFLANTSNLPVKVKATFRIDGEQPQLFNPITGQITNLDIIDRSAGRSSISLSLDAYESALIVWSKVSALSNLTTATAMPQPALPPIDLGTDWTVQFGHDAPAIQRPLLTLWTDDPATRNFSGIASYTHHATVPQPMLMDGSTVFLTLGPSKPAEPQNGNHRGSGFEADLTAPVREAAVIYINGHRAGSVWSPPYQLDVTGWLTPGDNTIRIDVANTAVNAIAAHGFPNYDVKAIVARFGDRFPPPLAKNFQPVPSGLTGPITLTCRRP
jgi:hypothetical protein